MADETVKLEIWRLRLKELEFDVVHRAGIKHQVADALSRIPTDGVDKGEIDDDIPVLMVDEGNDTVCLCQVCDQDKTIRQYMPEVFTITENSTDN